MLEVTYNSSSIFISEYRLYTNENSDMSYIFYFIANIENPTERKSVQMDSQGSSRRSSACSVPDVDTCGLEEEQV